MRTHLSVTFILTLPVLLLIYWKMFCVKQLGIADVLQGQSFFNTLPCPFNDVSEVSLFFDCLEYGCSKLHRNFGICQQTCCHIPEGSKFYHQWCQTSNHVIVYLFVEVISMAKQLVVTKCSSGIPVFIDASFFRHSFK